MIMPEKKRTEDINKEIQSLRCDIDKLDKKQDTSSQVQMKYWFVAYGVAIMGIAFGAVALRSGADIVICLFILLLLVVGLISIIYSGKLASDIWRRALRQGGSNVNQRQLWSNVPRKLKALVKATACTLFILGLLYLVVGFIYVVLSIFGLFSLTLSAMIIAMLFVLGIAHLILFYAAMIISGYIE